MCKNAQKVEWKTWSKISSHYTWLLHAKIAHLDDVFSEVFKRKQAQQKGNHYGKKKRKGEKGKAKEKSKNRKA